MKTLDTDKGLIGHGFSRPFSRTLFDAIIALRGASCGKGFGAKGPVYQVSDTRNVANAHNATTVEGCNRCGVRCGLLASEINSLSQPTTPQRLSRAYTYTRASLRVRGCAITCATVVALWRCALSLLFLYLPEKKEEKQGVCLSLPTTPAGPTVVASVVGWRKPLKSLDMRGF